MAGRHRNDGPRHPNGQPVRQRDTIPERVLEQRRLLVGSHADPRYSDGRKCDPRDPLAGVPVGVLFLRGAIRPAELDVALRYEADHRLVFGGHQPRSHLGALMPQTGGGEISDKVLLEAGTRLGEANVVLLELPTRRPYDVFVNLVVYQRLPRFMDIMRARSPAAWKADQRDLDALCEATDALVRAQSARRKAA